MCRHGKTQNADEAFNKIVWERALKNVILGLNTLKIATVDAVLTFIDRSIARADILRSFGVSPRRFTVQRLHEVERRRLYFAERATRLCLANVEAFIDFSEDQGIEETILDSAAAQAEKLATEIQIHLLDGRRGERLRDGVKVAIIGRTNVGKSSLFNALCQRDAAIVSPIAGTTRDVIESTLEIGGYPAVFSDTAGLRHSNDPVECEGILRAQHWAANADLALIVVEARELLQLKPTTDFIDDHLKELGVESCAEHRLIIFNKLDLLSEDEQVAVEQHAKSMCVDNCFTSCTTQQGISDLVKILGGHLEDLCGKPADLSPTLTRERHRRHLDQCLKHLKLFSTEVRHDSVIGAEHLRIALSNLGRITGRVFTEEILDVIFRDFCIGK